LAQDRLLDEIESCLGKPIGRLHDVGTGVGFLLEAAELRGIRASGNELNGYACRVMRERLGFDVHNESLPDLKIEDGSLDTVTMCDYLEHSYHPYVDIRAAHGLLRSGGILYLNTFHIECRAFDQHRENWNFLFWNHTHHFTTAILERMLTTAGYEIAKTKSSYEDPLVSIFAVKR